MGVNQHRSKTFHGFSTPFLENAALFTASKEAYALGNFFKVNLPTVSLYVVNDPEILKHILIDKESKYEKSIIYWRELRRVIGKAMGSLEGEEWTILKHLQKTFFTRSHVQSYMEEVNKISQKGIYALAENKEMDLLAAMSAINLEIILKTIFGIEDKENAPTVARMIEEGEAYIAWRSKFPWRPYIAVFTPFWIKTKKALKYLSEWSSKLITQQNYDKSSMLQALVESGYSHLHIRNEMIVHLGASTETVAVTECWTLYLLSKHNNYYQLVMEEIDSNYQAGNNDFSKFPLMTAVVKEAMRLYPPSHAIIRDCISQDGDIIQGHHINKGDVMYISAFGIHRNPSIWEAADDFRPERFMNGNDELIPTYAYLPFAAGKHACIGKYLALPMVLTKLILLLRAYHIIFSDKEEKIPISLSTLKPHNGFLVTLTSKQRV